MNGVNIKLVRRFPIVLFFGILMFNIVLMFFTVIFPHETVVFKARISKNLPQETYHKVQVNESYIITGLEGDVHWKPKSIKEAWVLQNVVNSQNGYSYLDLLYFLLFDIILFWMVYDIESNQIFSKKVIKGLRLISYFILLLSFKNLFQYFISDYFLKEITNSQFGAVREQRTGFIPYYFCFSIFQIVPYFISQAQKIEQDQNLTV